VIIGFRRLQAVLVIGGVTIGAVGCAPNYRLVSTPPPRHAAADALAPVPKFVVVPALDLRPQAEHGGAGAEPGFFAASSGGGMSHFTGAETLAGDDRLQWSPGPFHGAPPSASTAVAADLGRALASAADRPVDYAAQTLDAAAVGAPDGAVVVSIVIDHLTMITPRNADFEQTKSQQGDYEVTTTKTATEEFGPFWVFAFRVQLGEVHGGRITRRLVRYAAASGTAETGYTQAIDATVDQVVTAAATWQVPVQS
jgi:hypothetical protein